MKALYILILSFLTIQGINAQTLHALLVGATEDESIGKGASVDLDNMLKLVQDVVAVTDCEPDILRYNDSDCTKKKVIEWINSRDIKNDDVVLFFYSGHGGRAINDPDSFPQMCMNRPAVESLYMPVSHVDKLLERKGAKFRIIITNCCNSKSDNISIKPLFAMSSSNSTMIDEYDLQKLIDLFFNQKGRAIITSSKPGQYSWIDSRSHEEGGTGGVFTSIFIDSFNRAVKNGSIDASWKSIFKNAHDLTLAINIPNKGKIYKQEPHSIVDAGATSDKGVKRHEYNQPGSLFESLNYLVNDKISTDTRLGRIREVAERHFKPGAKVITIAQNGTTVVDYEDVNVFLRRITLSPFIKQISIIDGDNQDRNSVIKVHEVRTQNR